PSVVGLYLQSVRKPPAGSHLQSVVMAVGSGVELGDSAKSRVPRLAIGKRRKAAFAYRLIAVGLRLVGLVYRARAHILSTQIHGRADLALKSKAPLHVIRRAQRAIRDGGDGNRLKAGVGL